MRSYLRIGILVLPTLTFGVTAAVFAQRAADPHIVSPRATPDLHPSKRAGLPYHFLALPAPMPGQKFGNVSGVALTPQGHLLVDNRNNHLYRRFREH